MPTQGAKYRDLKSYVESDPKILNNTMNNKGFEGSEMFDAFNHKFINIYLPFTVTITPRTWSPVSMHVIFS